jgi:Reverse transcriptase (RNA-dependent DNA polymerase)
LSRAQKGFTPSRYIHEVILNIANNIAYCNTNNISGAIVSIDQAKAFDTILHGFVRESFRFFGFNERFLNMLDTLGTNRQAHIITGSGNTVTKNFSLGTGRAQGGILSPLEFNAGEQILILKIEFDPGIKSIYYSAVVPRSAFPVDPANLNPHFRYECNSETDKADGFADDVSVGTIMETPSINRLKLILIDFGNISGLKCNVDKTCILPIGTAVPDDEIIADTGFHCVNELTILGFTFNRDGLMINQLFSNVYEKIGRIITMWDRFQLSIPGRIGIYKTLLLSQITYVGSVCSPSDTDLVKIQKLMDNYVIGNLQVSEDRKYRPAEESGLGLIKLKNFLAGIQAVWVKRAHISTRDNWRNDLRTLSLGNCYAVSPILIDNIRFPLLGTILTSFDKFRTLFYDTGTNFRESYIINNKKLVRGEQDTRILDKNFFESNIPRLNIEQISALTVKDFFQGNLFKSLDELILDTGINFSLLTYMRLRESIMLFQRRNPNKLRGQVSISLEKFLNVKKGEAKKICTVLDNSDKRTPVRNLRPVKTYFRLIGVDPTEELSRKVLVFGINLT